MDFMKNLVLPDDITLGVARNFFMHDRIALNLASHIKLGRQIRIRFVLHTEPETEAPDAMTMGTFRSLCASGSAHISIDDEGGGRPVRAPEPELVS